MTPRAAATVEIKPAIAPAILDMEASGFGKNSYPIEVGYVLPDGQAFCTLIRPASGWTHWDASAEALHGISRERMIERGRTVGEVATHLNEHLAGLTVYSDGWANDYSWLAALFDAADQQPAFRLDNLRALLHEDEAARWHDTKESVMREMHLQRHRASSDARLLQLTIMRLREKTAR